MKTTATLINKNIAEYFSVFIFAIASGLILLIQLYFHSVFHYSVIRSATLLCISGVGQFVGAFIVNLYVKLIAKALGFFNKNNISSVRFSLVVIGLMSMILFVLFDLNHSYYLFLILCFFLGLFLAFFYPIIQALLFENASVQESVSISSIIKWAINLGTATAFTLIGVLTHNKASALFISIAFFMLSFVVINLFKLNQHSVFDSREIKKFSHEKGFSVSKPMLIWLVGLFLGVFVYFQFISTYAIYLNHYYNIGSEYYSRLMYINVVMVILFQFMTPALEKRLGLNNIACIGVFLIGLSIIIVVGHNIWLVFASFVIWTIGEILFMGVAPVYIKVFAHDKAEKNLKYSSYYYSVYYLGKMLGPIVGSYFYEECNLPKTVLVSSFIISIFAALGFIYLGSLLKKTSMSKHQSSSG